MAQVREIKVDMSQDTGLFFLQNSEGHPFLYLDCGLNQCQVRWRLYDKVSEGDLELLPYLDT